MTERHDIVIAGGGMVGLSLALLLGEALPETVRICLVESFPLGAGATGERPAYHPSFDARSTALSYSSREIYLAAGLWPELEQWLCPIETIHVSTRGRFGSTLMAASDYDWSALGYVVENAWLGQSLLRAVQARGRVELLSPARVAAVVPDGAGVRLELADGSELDARLLVVADGAASGLRESLGVAVDQRAYQQRALIANVVSDRPHAGCAFERFTDEGPLALLPLLPAPAAEHRSALVWTLPPERAAGMLVCPEDAFLAELQGRFGYRLGRLRKVSERHDYPLMLARSREQVRQAVVVMGNAAHTLHPVAGQGYNLALRDAAELTTQLAGAFQSGLSPGDLAVLERYRDRQLPDQARTIGMSHWLPGLFMAGDPVLGLGRDLALAGLDVVPPLKREFVRQAAGIAARSGRD